jgi:hypothetical protein
LRVFLRELNPAARALLRTEIERAAARGDEVPVGDFILQELRRDLPDAGPAPSAAQPSSAAPPPNATEADRIESAARVFFTPLEPFGALAPR